MRLSNEVVQRCGTLSALLDTPGSLAQVPSDIGGAAGVTTWAMQAEAGICNGGEHGEHQIVSLKTWQQWLRDLKVRFWKPCYPALGCV